MCSVCHAYSGKHSSSPEPLQAKTANSKGSTNTPQSHEGITIRLLWINCDVLSNLFRKWIYGYMKSACLSGRTMGTQVASYV